MPIIEGLEKRMKVYELFTKDALEEALANKMVKVEKHPSLDLYVYNYTASCQFNWAFNEVTMNCRGLVVNSENEIIARPFKKFFSLEQLEGNEELSLRMNQPVEVFDKADGSLGIIFRYKEQIITCTRGSFVSDQAKKAKELVDKYYASLIEEGYTYLVEIIYPQNRVVVSYGSLEDLILLSVIDTTTGEVKLDEYNRVSEERDYLPN